LVCHYNSTTFSDTDLLYERTVTFFFIVSGLTVPTDECFFLKGIRSGIVLSDVTWAVKNRPYERCGKHPIDTPGDDALLRARPRLLMELLEAQRFLHLLSGVLDSFELFQQKCGWQQLIGCLNEWYFSRGPL
jgi:hypothetical protein